MDLFVINRYQEENEDIDHIAQESKHLEKLKQKIAERKKHHLQHKALDITLVEQPVIDKNIYNDTDPDSKNEGTKPNNDNLFNKSNEKSQEQNYKPTTVFKVLGSKDFEKREKVKRILPYWLSHSVNIPVNLQNLTISVKDVAWLHSTLKTTLLSEGITHIFPVQEKVIPYILEQHKKTYSFWPCDVCVSAPTGSGKTLSFVLPIIQILMNKTDNNVRALVVLPVQELATQVANVFRKYCTKTGLKVAILSGSTPLIHEQQQIVKYTESESWVSKVDIIVSTAGRLVEHLQNTEGFSLKDLKFLVIDEADRIMDHIQNDWLYHLDKHIQLQNSLMTGKMTHLSWRNLINQKKPPHKLLFSATLSQDPEKLEQWGLFQPTLFSSNVTDEFENDIDITKYTTPDELTEEFVTCSAEEKPIVLYHFLVEQKWNKVLCFTNAAQSAHRLTVLLNIWGNGTLKVAELSAALDRTNREIVLKKFNQSEIDVIISTDALARGIDIPYCEHVISYDPPRHIKTYIHRVGRTGRAGRSGRAMTLLLPNQINLFRNLLQSGSKSNVPQIKIDQQIYERLSKTYENALIEMKQTIQDEVNRKVMKSIKLKRKKSISTRKKAKKDKS